MTVMNNTFSRLFAARATSFIFVIIFLLNCNNKPEVQKNIGDDLNNGSKPVLSLGLAPEINIFEQKKRYQPLIEYLTEKTGIKIELSVKESYKKVVDHLLDGTIDIAFVGSLDYVICHSLKKNNNPLCEILARPLGLNGISTYRSYIFARKESHITKNVSTWKGKKISLVHTMTMAGDTFPRYHLKLNNINSFDLYFKNVTYTGSHDATFYSVINKETEIGACKDLVFHKLIKENPEFEKDLTVLAVSEEVPSNGLVVSNIVSQEQMALLKETLLTMHNDQKGKEILVQFQTEKFLPTKDSDYENLYKMIRGLGTTAVDIYNKSVK